MNINFYNLLIISGVINGLIFGFVILLNPKHKHSSNFYIAQVVIYLSLNNLYYWIIDTGLSERISFYESLYVPWSLLILPLYYYFVLVYLKIQSKKKIFFLIPFFVSLSAHFLLLLDNLLLGNYFHFSAEFIYYFYYTEEYFSIVYTFFLIFKTFTLIKRSESKGTAYSYNKVAIKTKWLKQLLLIGIIICTIWIALTIYSQYNRPSAFNVFSKYFLWISISFLTYWLGYSAFFYNYIYEQRVSLRKVILKQKNSLGNSQTNIKFNELKNIIRNQLLYLDPNFNLASFARKINLSEGYISQLFSQYSTMNFSSYINNLRVATSKNLLQNPDFKGYTIISIGLESGFNSKSAFYSAFKKETGLTPTKYRVQNLS
jgi:AraC-like DNA-binding protein